MKNSNDTSWDRSFDLGTVSFPGGKMRPGRAADHSPPLSAAVVEV